MTIKVRRKANAPRVNRFSVGDHPSLEFSDKEEIFEIPVTYLSMLSEYFEPFFPVSDQEKRIGEFMFGGEKKKESEE